MFLWGQNVEEVGEYYILYIRKPIYGTCVAINEKIIEKAKKNNKRLVIQCPGGEETVSPQEWIKRSKRIEKVFKYPDNPMVLYQGTIKEKSVT